MQKPVIRHVDLEEFGYDLDNHCYSRLEAVEAATKVHTMHGVLCHMKDLVARMEPCTHTDNMLDDIEDLEEWIAAGAAGFSIERSTLKRSKTWG